MPVAARRASPAVTDIPSSSILNAFWAKASTTDPRPTMDVDIHDPPGAPNSDFIDPKVVTIGSVTLPPDADRRSQLSVPVTFKLPMTHTFVTTLLTLKSTKDGSWTVALGFRFEDDTGLEFQAFPKINDIALNDVDGSMHISCTALADNTHWLHYNAA